MIVKIIFLIPWRANQPIILVTVCKIIGFGIPVAMVLKLRETVLYIKP